MKTGLITIIRFIVIMLAEGEEYREAPFDGKWRYLLHDLDYSFGIYGTAPWEDNLGNMLVNQGT